MAFEDLRERVQSEIKNFWENFQESSLFIRLKERYENLTPVMQKGTLIGGSLLLAYMILSIPLSYYSSSNSSVESFEGKRQLIRDLLKVSRESQDAPNLPVPPDLAGLRTQIDTQLAAVHLLPEQMRGTESSAEATKLIPGSLSQGALKVSLAQLNLRQVIDFGYLLQSISPSVKMTDLHMEANGKDPRYYDVVYKLAILAVPNQPEQVEPEAAPPPAKKRGK